MAISMCGPTTGKARAGIRPLCDRRPGRIVTVGRTIEVAFERADEALNDRIDEAYRVKYRGNPYLDPMIGVRARSATVRITPVDPR
jgi:hypothetical protein